MTSRRPSSLTASRCPCSLATPSCKPRSVRAMRCRTCAGIPSRIGQRLLPGVHRACRWPAGGRLHHRRGGRATRGLPHRRSAVRSACACCRCCLSKATISAPVARKSGHCLLQDPGRACRHDRSALREPCNPERPVDASHPDVLFEPNRCILCQLCVRASDELDGKQVFAIGGHGVGTRLLVNSASGQLGDSVPWRSPTGLPTSARWVRCCPSAWALRCPSASGRFDTQDAAMNARTSRCTSPHAPGPQAARGHGVARGLLWLPHVLPGHRRAPVRTDRSTSSSTARR